MVVIPGGGCATVAIADATALCRCLVLQPGLTERRWLCPNSFVNLPPHEGDAIAEWLAAHGVTAFLLRYRLISSGYSIPTQLADTRERQCRYSLSAKCATGSQRLDPRGHAVLSMRADVTGVVGVSAGRAVQFVRAHAAAWDVDPTRVGVIRGTTQLCTLPARPYGTTLPITGCLTSNGTTQHKGVLLKVAEHHRALAGSRGLRRRWAGRGGRNALRSAAAAWSRCPRVFRPCGGCRGESPACHTPTCLMRLLPPGGADMLARRRSSVDADHCCSQILVCLLSVLPLLHFARRSR